MLKRAGQFTTSDAITSFIELSSKTLKAVQINGIVRIGELPPGPFQTSRN